MKVISNLNLVKITAKVRRLLTEISDQLGEHTRIALN